MNSENNELSHNDVEINVSEENILLAPPVELFDEAKFANELAWKSPYYLRNKPKGHSIDECPNLWAYNYNIKIYTQKILCYRL